MRYLVFFLPALLLSQTLKDSTPLRSSCSASDVLATLPKDAPVKIRFAIAGSDNPCYAVTAELDGQKLQGYVSAAALSNLDQFEKSRREAAVAALPRPRLDPVPEASATPSDATLVSEVYRALSVLEAGHPADVEAILAKAGAPPNHRDAAMVRAAALIELNQPDRALEILQPAMREHRRDPQLLSLAGMASYRLDDPRTALAYWREAQTIQPDPGIADIVRNVEREVGADTSSQKSYGMRFLLRYDGAVAAPEQAREMVEALEQEFSRVSFQLGCRAGERIVTIVQSPEAYRRSTGATEWSGGHFDGKIRIPLAAGRIDPQTRRVFAHEIVHACMASLGRWPAWLHEALAQTLSGDTLTPSQKIQLRAMKVPSLESLEKRWTAMGAADASLHYMIALAAGELLVQKHNLRNLMNNPATLPRIAADLDRALAESLR